MASEKQIALHKYYILMDRQTMKPIWIRIGKKDYMFLINRDYFFSPKKDFFNLNEKLFILNLPWDVAWAAVPDLICFFIRIFFNTITPMNLQLNINNGKVKPYILKKGVFNIAKIFKRTL